MQRPGGDLNVDIGIGLEKLTRQLAAAEARMVRAARNSERGFTRSNTRIATDFRRVTQATDNLAASTSRLSGSNGLRQVALQLNQVGSQGSVTGNYLQALAIQLPDLLLGFGTFGALLGAVAGPLAIFASGLLTANNEAQSLVDQLLETSASLESVRGDLNGLRELQEKYTQAIAASAGASGATAAAVAANSKREFDARRQVLAVEVELLQIRGQEQRESLRNLEDQGRQLAENMREQAAALSVGTRQSTDAQGFAFTGPRTASEALGPIDRGLLEGAEQRRLAIRKLRAETELMALAVEEANAALNGEFRDVGAGAAATGTAAGGGGGRAARSATVDVERLKEATDELKLSNEALQRSFEGAFVSLVTGAASGREAIASLASDLARMLASQAFQRLAGFIFGGVGGAVTSSIRPMPRPPSFDGGGFTGMGVRAGGVDGKGGFPAVLHPNEQVIDSTRRGGGSMTEIVVRSAPGVTIEQVRGEAVRVVQSYDRQALPRRMRQIGADPRRIG